MDQADSHNPQAVAEHASECFHNMQRVESLTRATAHCIRDQREITKKMRQMLIGWLIEVHLKFKLLPETLYLTVNLIDRYCQVKQVTKIEYQLLGISAMLVASKYEEIYPPEIRDYIYMTDKAYTKD